MEAPPRRFSALLALAIACAPAYAFARVGPASSVPAGFAGAYDEAAAHEPDRVVALLSPKILTATLEGRGVIDDGVLVLSEGRIVAVGAADQVELPPGCEVIDVAPNWLAPGFVDLHSHVGGSRDINGAVYQVNPGLRVSPSVIPETPALERAVAAGVTTILFIPGSATNMGGQGVLLKTAPATYEQMLVRQPGSMKIAQGDNPTRWSYGMGRGLMNFHLRTTLRKGRAYAERWRAAQAAGGADEPLVNISLEPFRALFAHEAQISTHTQYYQLVLTSITMLRGEFGLDIFIDHGTFDGYRTAPLAQEVGVAAIIGPRQISRDGSRYPNDLDGSIVGCAAEYQARGHALVGFNTDAPVVPQEELSLQSAMGTRYGFDNSSLGALRGLTIVPAIVAGIDEQVGSLEPGKDADVLVLTGDPSDPRTAVEQVFVDGQLVYDASTGRSF